MSNETRRWLFGLVAAFVGGLAGALDSGLALMMISPAEFNLGEGLIKTLGTVGVLGLLTGIKVAAAYLKQSPLPREVWTPAERAASGSDAT